MDAQSLYAFDVRGYCVLSDVLARPTLDVLNAEVDRRAALEMRDDDSAFIWGDRSALMRDSTGAPREKKGPSSENIQSELLQWGRPFTDLIDLLEPALTTLFGGRFRLDHYYLNLLKHGNRVTSRGLHGNQGGLGSYHVHDDQPRCSGLITVALELMPVPPGCGGFACIEGSHKANFDMPAEWRSLAAPQGSEITHPFARAVPADAGSAIVFTEALAHGTFEWTGPTERRTLFLKYTPLDEALNREFLVPEMVPAEHGELREGVRRLLVPPEGTRWRPKL